MMLKHGLVQDMALYCQRLAAAVLAAKRSPESSPVTGTPEMCDQPTPHPSLDLVYLGQFYRPTAYYQPFDADH